MSIGQTFKQIIDLISSPEIQAELFPAKVVFIFFTVVLLIITLYFVFVSSYLKYRFIADLAGFFNIQPASIRRIAARWKQIKERISGGSESEYKMAILEADDLFIEIMKEKGFQGKTFEDLIGQLAKIKVPGTEAVAESHKIRNSVVYDPNYKITQEEVKKVIGSYEKAIKDIQSF